MSDQTQRTRARILLHNLEKAFDETAKIEILSELLLLGPSTETDDLDLREKNTELQEKINELNGANSELRRELAESRRSRDELNGRLAVAEHKIAEIEREQQTQTQRSVDSKTAESTDREIAVLLTRKSERYRFEAKFTGQDGLLYSSFQRHIRIILSQNQDWFPTLQSKIMLIYRSLGPEPQAFLDQHLDDGNFIFNSIQEVWDKLDIPYLNPNEEEEARATLSSLKQRNRTFRAYLGEFQKHRLLSGITDDGTLISFMRAGISREMRAMLNSQQDISKRYTYDEFVTLCKECNQRLTLERLRSRP